MKILLIHNFHRRGGPSGDDVVVREEYNLLVKNGHEVYILGKSNDDFYQLPISERIRIFTYLDFNRESYQEVKGFLKNHKVDIAHVHNIFPLWSPSVYFALKEAGIPIVQTLHDFRFFCANAFLIRNGRFCDLCPKRSTFYAFLYRCFKDSYIGSFFVARYLSKVKRGRYFNLPDKVIALSDYAQKLLEGFGVSEDKLVVKPNFVEPLVDKPHFKKEGFFLFVGRLSYEKGVDVLLQAFERPELKEVNLKIVGTGPEEDKFRDYVKKRGLKNVEFLGFRPREEVIDFMQKAQALIFPSLWPETFGLVILEAYQSGTPVIATSIGASYDLVEEGKTGLLFERGNPDDLASEIIYLHENPHLALEMGKMAYQKFLREYTPEANYNKLMEIYNEVLRRKGL